MVSEKAVTETGAGLRDYELTVIIKPDIDAEKLEARINAISQFITDKGGTVSEIQKWGKRKLGYPIKRILEGIYVLVKCKMKPASGKELEATLRISEDILRHLLIVIES
ncbi:MAG: 30S ribosomal protein S6 [Dehalococcoidales bacterium]|nr:30S ribosomal protein S6 [Dehalococcoidales bacterium]